MQNQDKLAEGMNIQTNELVIGQNQTIRELTSDESGCCSPSLMAGDPSGAVCCPGTTMCPGTTCLTTIASRSRSTLIPAAITEWFQQLHNREEKLRTVTSCLRCAQHVATLGMQLWNCSFAFPRSKLYQETPSVRGPLFVGTTPVFLFCL